MKHPEEERTLFVSTAHYAVSGRQLEMDSSENPRIPQARRTIEVPNELVPSTEALLFLGDLNDGHLSIRILREGGLTDSFAALGRYTSPTWPAAPITQGTPVLTDWALCREPICPMTSDVVDFYVGGLPPSDHKPLVAAYRLL